MDLSTSQTATIALVAGALVLLLGLAWALRGPRAPGRRLVPRTGVQRAVSGILLLDGCVLLVLGALWHLDGDGDAGPAGRDGRSAVGDPPAAPAASAAPDAAPEAPDAAPEAPAAQTQPAEPAEAPAPGAQRGPRRTRGFLVARLSGDGAGPGRADPDGRGGVRLDVRPGRRHLCFDMAIDRRVRGGIAQANVYREADGEGALPHLTLVVPDDKFARRRRGCAFRPPTAALRAVLDAPQDFHVTIFTATHPDGAVRGTLRTCPRPCPTRAPDLLG